MFNNLRYRSGLKKIDGLQKKIKRKKFIYNLETARKVGIVFEGSVTGVPEEVKDFILYLKKRNLDVHAIGYVDIKELTVGLEQHPTISFFAQKDLKWNGTPKSPQVFEFTDIRLDILIDFSRRELMPIRSVVALSHASFKVGFQNYFHSPFDFILSVKESESLSFIIEQVKHYLLAINNRHYQVAHENDSEAEKNHPVE